MIDDESGMSGPSFCPPGLVGIDVVLAPGVRDRSRIGGVRRIGIEPQNEAIALLDDAVGIWGNADGARSLVPRSEPSC